MDIFQISLQEGVKKLSFSQKLRKIVVVEKLYNPAGIIALLLITCSFALIISKLGIIGGLLLLGIFVGIPFVMCVIAYPKFGILILLTMAYFLMFIIKFNIPFPLGTVMDGLEALLFLGFFIKQKNNRNYKIFNNGVSVIVAVWIAYNVLEVINPVADSMLAWVFTIRTIAFVSITYFVFMYNINTLNFLRTIIKLWLVFALIAALYGIKQEHTGYSQFEWAEMASDPGRASLLFIDGHWRKFSIFDGPVTFAYNMVLGCLLCVGLMWGIKALWKKLILVGFVVMFFMSMLYSGTRGAFALIPAGMVLFCILNFNKTTLLFGSIVAVIFAVLIVIPTTDENLRRFQTAFQPNNDPSYILRQQNLARIRPYIQTHPIGGGLGSVGIWGQKFSPNSMLSKFPPDSGYVRVAVEEGWIGLFLICAFMFVILRAGIQSFFIIKNNELKAYCLAMVIMIFAIEVGNYPQEALVQYPTNVYFYLMIAIMVKCGQLDKQLQEEKENTIDGVPHNLIVQ